MANKYLLTYLLKSNGGEIIKRESWGRYRDDTFAIEVGELSKIENVDGFTKHINGMY